MRRTSNDEGHETSSSPEVEARTAAQTDVTSGALARNSRGRERGDTLSLPLGFSAPCAEGCPACDPFNRDPRRGTEDEEIGRCLARNSVRPRDEEGGATRAGFVTPQF